MVLNLTWVGRSQNKQFAQNECEESPTLHGPGNTQFLAKLALAKFGTTGDEILPPKK